MKRILIASAFIPLLAFSVASQAQEERGDSVGDYLSELLQRAQLINAIDSIKVAGSIEKACIFVDAAKLGGLFACTEEIPDDVVSEYEVYSYVSASQREETLRLFNEGRGVSIPVYSDVKEAALVNDFDPMVDLIWAQLLTSQHYGGEVERQESLALPAGAARLNTTPYSSLYKRLKELIKDGVGAKAQPLSPEELNAMLNKGKNILQEKGILDPNDLRRIVPATDDQIAAIQRRNEDLKKQYEAELAAWNAGGGKGPKPTLTQLPVPDQRGLKPNMNAGGLIDPKSSAKVSVDAPHPPRPGVPNQHGPGALSAHVHVTDKSGNRIASVYPLPKGTGGVPRSVTIPEKLPNGARNPVLNELIEAGQGPNPEARMKEILEKLYKQQQNPR